MAFVYILESKRNGKYYIGATDGSIEARLKKHQQGGVSFTSRNLPVELVFVQRCPNMEIACAIEKKLKGFKRRDYIEKIISEGRIKLLDRYGDGWLRRPPG